MDRMKKKNLTYLSCVFFSPTFQVIGGHEIHSASLERDKTVSLVSIFHDIKMLPLRRYLTCSSPRILKWWSSLIKESGQPAVGKKQK